MAVSTEFAASLRVRAADLIENGGFIAAVRALLTGAPAVHADAIDAGVVLTELSSVLVRDGYARYAHLTNVLHAWCGAHLLRDLRGIFEADPAGQLLAKALGDTLLIAHLITGAARAEGRDTLTDRDLSTINQLYTGALARARTDNPAPPAAC